MLSKPLHAIHVAERTKKRKYEDQARARGHDFVPLAFGTRGGMADDVGNLLRKLAANTNGAQGHAVSDMELDLALTLVRGNADCASKTMERAHNRQDQQRSIIASPL